MNKNNSSKKNTIEQLYKILDNDSKKDSLLKDENILKSLSLRLKSSNKKIELKPKVIYEQQEPDFCSLEPKVDIHARERKKFVYKKEIPKEKPYEKDLLEIEKVDVIEYKFSEVKSEGTTAPKIKIISKEEESPETELVEWEEVSVKSSGSEKIKDEISEKVITEPVEFIEKKDDEILEERKTRILPTFGRFRKSKKEIEEVKLEEPEEFEETEEKKPEIPFEEIPSEAGEFDIDFVKKIETFKDYKTINEKTAIILYNNGYKTTESLKNATVEDLKNINGIKKRQAKKIIKEVNKKFKEEEKPEATDVYERVEETKEFEKREEELPLFQEADKSDLEWKQVDIKDLEGKEAPLIIEESYEEQTKKIDTFKDFQTIDEETALLLYNSGFTTIDSLNNATVKQLRKIKGIKRRQAKKIKKEIDKKIRDEEETKMIDIDETLEKQIKHERPYKKSKRKKEDELLITIEKKATRKLKKEKEGFKYKGYTLYEKKIKTKSGKKSYSRFFSKLKQKHAEPIKLPKNFKVLVNKNGVPYIKEKK